MRFEIEISGEIKATNDEQAHKGFEEKVKKFMVKYGLDKMYEIDMIIIEYKPKVWEKEYDMRAFLNSKNE